MELDSLQSLLDALVGPAGAIVLLTLVLFGVWKLINKGIDLFSAHLSKIETLFSEAKEEVKNLNSTVGDLKLSLDKHIFMSDTRLSLLERDVATLKKEE